MHYRHHYTFLQKTHHLQGFSPAVRVKPHGSKGLLLPSLHSPLGRTFVLLGVILGKVPFLNICVGLLVIRFYPMAVTMLDGCGCPNEMLEDGWMGVGVGRMCPEWLKGGKCPMGAM